MLGLFLLSGHHHFVRTARKIAFVFLAASSLVLSGCTRLEVKLGTKVQIATLPVMSAAANLPKGPAIPPGGKSPLVVTFVGSNGKTYVTEGQGKGKVMWQDLKVTATIASVNKKGVVAIPRDPRLTDGKTPHVSITVPSHPDLHAELDIPVRYDVAFAANFSGASGAKGADGIDGTNGSSGSMGSTDPNNPSAGGDGGDGTNGTDGSNGQDGGDAPAVQVHVALQSGTHPLLQVAVYAAGRTKLFLIDPQGGSLMVRADGGSGGLAGHGGRGGSGGSGGVGTPNGNSGRSGSNGQDGMSGSDGRGGQITVTYDPQAKPYIGIIHTSSMNGPPPAFIEQPVAAPW